MNAEKSESSRLSRRNISVAASAHHWVMEFLRIVSACSSESLSASNAAHGTSVSRLQRTDSNDLNNSGYSMSDPASSGKSSYHRLHLMPAIMLQYAAVTRGA